MKCKNCGAVVNPETLVCEYCGSSIEKKRKKVNSKVGSTLAIAITIILVSAVIFVGIPVALVMWAYSTSGDETSQQEYIGDRLPKEATDLVGVMGDCTTKGVTTIYYNDESYDDVKILDSEFIKWMEKEAIDPDGKSIMFSTDESGNITNVYIKEYDFAVMYRTGNTYVAFREDDRVITFETDMELEVDSWYTGYHHYADDSFHSAVDSKCYESYAEFHYVCREKAAPTEKCAISNKEVTVYKLRIGNDWHYCSKDTYDTVNVDDNLREGYTFVLAEPYVYKNK